MENQNNSPKDSNIGPIIGSIIIIVLIVLGGLYFWSYTKDRQKMINQEQEQSVQKIDSREIADPGIAQINDELNSTTTDVGNIDSELNKIDTEIDSALK
jgi:flagellar basal body-associated protein FliL